MRQLLKGGTIVSGRGCKQLDVLIEGETIIRVDKMIWEEEAVVVDVSGKLLFPGFIDAHTHFDLEVSKTVTADDFETGTKAALAGGTTMILDFATQYRSESLEKALENWHKKADGKCSCDYGFHLAISGWNEAVSKELEQVVKDGISSFKLYMTYEDMILSDKELYQVLKRIKEVGGIAGVHCENNGLIEAMVLEERKKGHFAPFAHPKSRPALAEAEAIGRLLKIAKQADTPVIIVHLSSKEGYQEVKYARGRGQEIYLEACPQYLLLEDSVYDLPDFEGSKYVISPPLRKREDQLQLWNALQKNEIQTIATDHCSFTMEQKAAGKADFTKIPCGMPGVESRPALLYTYGVLKDRITLEQMGKFLSENPAKLYGLYPRKGVIAKGSDADIVVWDPKVSSVVEKETQQSKAGYTPFEGWEIRGMAAKVYLRGQLVVEDGKIVNEKKGTYIKREKRLPLE